MSGWTGKLNEKRLLRCAISATEMLLLWLWKSLFDEAVECRLAVGLVGEATCSVGIGAGPPEACMICCTSMGGSELWRADMVSRFTISITITIGQF